MKSPLSWQPDMSDVDGPLYIALSDRMARDIAEGRLSEGTRLPPQRALAWALGVTHGTVTRAYERAEKMGLVKGEIGRGTFIAPLERPTSPLMPEEEVLSELDLAHNFPLSHLDPDLGEAFGALSQQAGIGRVLNYTPIEGLMRHREAGRALFSYFGVDAPVERILLTSGAQHALQVVLQGIFKDGDMLAVEALNYPGLISAAPRLGLRLAPVMADAEGMRADLLDELCRKRPVAGLVIGPNVHNPSGRPTSPKRLQELAECARRHDLWVIEDDPYCPILAAPKNSMSKIIPERTCSIASASKILGGGLRTGFICAPQSVRSSLLRVIADISSMSSPIGAELVRYWIDSGEIDRNRERKREALNQRHAIARAQFGKAIELYPERFCGWLHLPAHQNPAVFELEAARRGITVLGAHHFAVGTSPVPAAARLALGAIPSVSQFEKALTLLGDSMRDLEGTASVRADRELHGNELEA
nr:PLP-dependent aminotransferase family protein [uncultured Cohaesibacter sp.]